MDAADEGAPRTPTELAPFAASTLPGDSSAPGPLLAARGSSANCGRDCKGNPGARGEDFHAPPQGGSGDDDHREVDEGGGGEPADETEDIGRGGGVVDSRATEGGASVEERTGDGGSSNEHREQGIPECGGRARRLSAGIPVCDCGTARDEGLIERHGDGAEALGELSRDRNRSGDGRFRRWQES